MAKKEPSEIHDISDYFPGTGGEYRQRNFLHYVKWRNKDVPKDYIDSFIPVILAGGRNTRFTEDPKDLSNPRARVSKPMQPIKGFPSMVRTINQLKSSGFSEKDIYVVTTFGFDYQSEPFWFFYSGPGKDMEVNNVSFHNADMMSRAQVVKKFAEGAVQYVEFDDTRGPSWHYKTKELPPKKNLLVVHADNVFYSDAPMRWFVTEGGKNLNDRSNGYTIFDMVRVEGENGNYDYKEDISAYAFDREAYNKVGIPKAGSTVSEDGHTEKKLKFELPKGYSSMSKDVCAAIERNGNPGSRLKSGMYFFNINSPAIYNMALWAETRRKSRALKVRTYRTLRLSGRRPNENPAEEEKDIEDAVKELAESFHFGDAEVREMRESLKQSMATGQDAAQESGLEDYLKKCGLDNLGEYPKFCLHLGTLIEMSGSSPVKEALKGEFGYSLMEFAEKNSTIAPELEDYIVKTMVLGKKKRETN